MASGGMTKDQTEIVRETEQLLHDARYNAHFAEMMRERGYNAALNGRRSWPGKRPSGVCWGVVGELRIENEE